MHRIDGDGHVGNAFADLDPETSTEGTVMTADWANAVQEEIAGVVEAAGMTLDKEDNTQLNTALQETYGAKGAPNTWTGVNTFTSPVVAPNTVKVKALIRFLSAGSPTVAGDVNVSGVSLSSSTSLEIALPFTLANNSYTVHATAYRSGGSAATRASYTLTSNTTASTNTVTLVGTDMSGSTLPFPQLSFTSFTGEVHVVVFGVLA